MIVVGLNHRTVPLDLLERMTVPAERLPKALHDLVSREHITEAVVLSTCNRTEIYATAEKYHGAMGDVRNSLSEMTHVAPEAFVGGTIGLVREGDSITIDAHKRLLQLNVPDAEIEKRRTAWKRPQPRYTTGVLGKYAKLVGTASKGAVTD